MNAPSLQPAGRRLPDAFWSNIALFTLPLMALTVRSGSAYPAALLILVGCIGLLHGSLRYKLPTEARWLFLSFVPLALCWLLDDVSSGLGGRGLEKPLKILATLPALYLLAHRPPAHKWLWLGLAGGCLLACAEAAYQFFILHIPRAEGAMFSIHFGDLAMMFGLMCLCAWNLPVSRPTWLRFGLLAVCLAGLLASILSGTRGAWLTFGLIAALYGTHLLRQGNFRVFGALLAGLLILTTGVLFGSKSLGVEERLQQAVHQMQSYSEKSQTNTSVGARLQMWHQAWSLYRQKPLLGWQHSGYLQQQQLGIQERHLDPQLAEYDHPHNELLNAAAKQGTVGILALLLAYGGPLWIFARGLRQAGPNQPALRAVYAAGILVPISHFGFGLTETYLPHNSTTTIYFYLLILLWGASWGLRNVSTSAPQGPSQISRL